MNNEQYGYVPSLRSSLQNCTSSNTRQQTQHEYNTNQHAYIGNSGGKNRAI